LVCLSAIVSVFETRVDDWFSPRVHNHASDVPHLGKQQILKCLGLNADHYEHAPCKLPHTSHAIAETNGSRRVSTTLTHLNFQHNLPVWPHSTAVRLLDAEAELNVIRAWLRHGTTAAVAFLVAIAAFASYLPARRASRADPNVVVQYQ
jgi:hypothetical protein